MEPDETPDRPAAGLSKSEVDLRRYEARLGLWKVVLGTLLVGLAGVLIPGAINLYTAYFENDRKQTELELSRQAAHQQYIKDFFTTAINQDIELRIRFADYFAHVAGPEQEGLWNGYLEYLKTLRDDNRQKINNLEKELVDFKRQSPEEIDNAEFDRINRELAWANAEIGYVPTERSAVIALANNSPIAKKVRLYKETTDLVQRLGMQSDPLVENSGDVIRFWDLYRKDLIGVESRQFAQIMVRIGRVLGQLTATRSPPTPELKALYEELLSTSRQELDDVAQFAVQQQQQQLQQQLQEQQVQQQQQQQQQQQLQQMQLPLQ